MRECLEMTERRGLYSGGQFLSRRLDFDEAQHQIDLPRVREITSWMLFFMQFTPISAFEGDEGLRDRDLPMSDEMHCWNYLMSGRGLLCFRLSPRY